jgi:uncharacterized protein (TIGR04255 family)
MANLPVAFKKSPLLEAVFELRFQPTIPTAGDLLPGLLYSELKAEYPDVQPLQMAMLPREVRTKEPNLLYQATHRLSGASRIVQVGDRVVSLSLTAPYPGWAKFKDAILQLLKATSATGMLRAPERLSFRYINVIRTDLAEPQLPLLNLRIDSPAYAFVERGFHLRFEHDEREFTTIVQIAPQTTAKGSSDSLVSGLLIDVDTIHAEPKHIFSDTGPDLLEDAHSLLKGIFFSLLTESALRQLEPIA